MTSARALLVAALLFPFAAQAQRRVSVRDDLPPDLTIKDIDRLSPARIAVERASELAITASQRQRLDSASNAYSAHLEDFARPLDTLQNILDKYHKWVVKTMVERMSSQRRAPTDDKERLERARDDSIAQARADQELERATPARNELNRILLVIRAEYDAQVEATNAVLDDAQRAKLEPILDGAADELTTRLHWARTR